ncbi:MAG: SufD family Fe-S cluster assembly protein, partial [Actinomycetota bacterium]
MLAPVDRVGAGDAGVGAGAVELRLQEDLAVGRAETEGHPVHGADARVTGAYAIDGRQHIDYDTLQEHAAPDTTSDLAFRGILEGRST